MLLVGVTGGIGSGKSTFATLLARLGAEVIDADQIGRDALAPGTPSWHSVVDTFGDDILSGAEIDRRRLAEIVFADRNKLAALNAIVHPVIVQEIADRLEVLRGTDMIVILDAALIVDLRLHEGLDVLIAVIAHPDIRSRRLGARGMAAADIRARMSAQVDPKEAAATADIVVRNDSSLEDLETEAERVYALLKEKSG